MHMHLFPAIVYLNLKKKKSVLISYTGIGIFLTEKKKGFFNFTALYFLKSLWLL